MFIDLKRGRLRLGAPALAVTLGLALSACSENATGPEGEPGPGPELQPSWRESVMTDVVSGDDFRIDDLASSRVFVVVISARSEKSRRQVHQVAGVLGSLIPDVVVVSFDQADSRETLAEFYKETAYPYHFVLGTDELESRMLKTFGPLVLDLSAYPIAQACPRDEGERLLPPGLKLSGRLEREVAMGCGSDPRQGELVPLNGLWTGEMTIVSGERVKLSGSLKMTLMESGSGDVSGSYGYSLRDGGLLESAGSVSGRRLDETTLELDLNDELGTACSVRAMLRQHGAILFGDHLDRCQGTQQGTMLVEPAAE